MYLICKRKVLSALHKLVRQFPKGNMHGSLKNNINSVHVCASQLIHRFTIS